jgi:hypothetical protein
LERRHSTLAGNNALPIRLIVGTDWYALKAGEELYILLQRLLEESDGGWQHGSVTSPAARAFFKHRDVRCFIPHGLKDRYTWAYEVVDGIGELRLCAETTEGQVVSCRVAVERGSVGKQGS